MASGINITTLTGERFDVDSSANLELNMGGISFLNGLADRTVTYSNSFKMPYTPNNHKLFGFASMPTRNNRPKIDVIIQKGIFQKRAVLTVLNADKGYNCSVSYDWAGVVEAMKAKVESIFADEKIIRVVNTDLTAEQMLTLILDPTLPVHAMIEYKHSLYNTYENFTLWCTYVKMWDLLQEFCALKGYTVDALSQAEQNMKDIELSIPFVYVYKGTYNAVEEELNIYRKLLPDRKTPTVIIADVVKAALQIYAMNIVVDGDKISLYDLPSLFASPITLDGFSDVTKKLYSGYAKNNYIKYKIADKEVVSEYFGSDMFLADGQGIKNVLEINNTVPKYYSGVAIDGYDVASSDPSSNTILMKGEYGVYNFSEAGTNISTGSYMAKPLTMSGFYSGILNGMFENPVILEASKWIDPLKANDIMTTRVINSVQLGGKYWVDSMQYSLVSGKSKLTLIKIQ